LLGSLSNAHARTLEQEQDTLAIKAESDEVREEEASTQIPAVDHSTLSRSWLATIQGELTELEKMILHDIEAATPKLDELVSRSFSPFLHFTFHFLSSSTNADISVTDLALGNTGSTLLC
jgi:hypothetical protein